MNGILTDISIYLVPLLAFLAIYSGAKARIQKRNLAAFNEAIATGMTEPASLHPVINVNRCLGCGSCGAACPEQGVTMFWGSFQGRQP